MIELGQQFGLYVIKDILKTGDSQVCCIAEDPFFNREVTLKVYKVEIEDSLAQVETLLEKLAVLDHPSIAPIYDSGTQEGCFYYTTAFYAGGNLAEQLQAPIPEERALQIIAELTQAFDYALAKGVGQDQVNLKDIYFDADGRAVIAAFGFESGLERIIQGQSESENPSSVATTLRNLGELLLLLLLGPEIDLNERIDDLAARVENPVVRRLVGRFMLPGEWRFASYAELLDELLGFNDVAKHLRLEPAMKNFEETVNITGSELPIAADDVDTQDTVNEIRRLVAEKNTIQKELDRALYERNLAKNKSTENSRELTIAQQAAAKAKEEANVAWELVAGQKYDRYRPVAWAVGGFVLGFLISGSYGYYYSEQTRNELLAKLEANEVLIKSATWQSVPAESLSEPASSGTAVESQQAVAETEMAGSTGAEVAARTEEILPVEPPVRRVAKPVAESTAHWWPAGSEFSAAAAIPIEQIKVALGFESTSTAASLPDQLRTEVLSAVQRWAEAWQSQDLGFYFSCYSEEYRPELGRSRQEWREMRRTRVSRPQWIELNLDDISLRQVDDNRVQVKLKQSYRSDFYQDQILKSINLIKEEGEWRILMERSLGMYSDVVGG